MDRSATAYSAARFVQGEMKDIQDFLNGTLKPASYITTIYEAATHLENSIDILKENYPQQHNADYGLRANAHYTITLQEMLKVAAQDDMLAVTVFDYLSPESKKDHLLVRKALASINITTSRSAYRAQLKANNIYQKARQTLGLNV